MKFQTFYFITFFFLNKISFIKSLFESENKIMDDLILSETDQNHFRSQYNKVVAFKNDIFATCYIDIEGKVQANFFRDSKPLLNNSVKIDSSLPIVNTIDCCNFNDEYLVIVYNKRKKSPTFLTSVSLNGENISQEIEILAQGYEYPKCSQIGESNLIGILSEDIDENIAQQDTDIRYSIYNLINGNFKVKNEMYDSPNLYENQRSPHIVNVPGIGAYMTYGDQLGYAFLHIINQNGRIGRNNTLLRVSDEIYDFVTYPLENGQISSAFRTYNNSTQIGKVFVYVFEYKEVYDNYYGTYTTQIVEKCNIEAQSGVTEGPNYGVIKNKGFLTFSTSEDVLGMVLNLEDCSILQQPQSILNTNQQVKVPTIALSKEYSTNFRISMMYATKEGSPNNQVYVEYYGECIHKCNSCERGPYTCTVCSDSNRDLNLNNCDCVEGFYDIVGVKQCGTCLSKCTSCSNGFECDVCKLQGENRLGPPTCLCETGFFEDLNMNCQKCNENCLGCENSKEQCTSCLYSYLTAPSCSCLEKQYPGETQCENCDVKCLSCENSAQNCTQCLDNTLQDVNKGCECIEGYFWNGLLCEKCHENCKSCSIAKNQCDSCKSEDFRDLDNTCICQNGYYEDVNQICQVCSYKCESCDINGECEKCSDILRRDINNNCECINNYYENYENQCLECSYKCESCQQDGSCQKCSDILRDINNNCECNQGYYEDTQNICQECSYKCELCNQDGSCQKCSNSSLRDINNECECIYGYYEDQNQKCQQCSYKCSSCNSNETCEICSSDLRNIENNCECIEGFYENSNKICEKCSYKCESCRENGQCNICSDPILRDINNECECVIGYYEKEQKCLLCEYPCFSCINSSTQCIKCYNYLGRNTSDCTCQKGYYENKTLQACIKCQNQCLECQTTSSICTKCSDFNMQLPDCKKSKDGFFEIQKDSSDEKTIYQKCDLKCSVCDGRPDFCVQCQGSNRSSPPYCNCLDGYYDNFGQNLNCQQKKCDKMCESCEQGVCKECGPYSFLDEQKNKCVCFEEYEKIQGFCYLKCENNQYRDRDSNECFDCFYLENNKNLCLSQCPQNYVFQENKCVKVYQNNQEMFVYFLIFIIGVVFLFVMAYFIFVRLAKNAGMQLYQSKLQKKQQKRPVLKQSRDEEQGQNNLDIEKDRDSIIKNYEYDRKSSQVNLI